MEQTKRNQGDSEVGLFTEVNKSKNNLCLYCGDNANTRDHAPSKVFIDENFMGFLPTVPSCSKCNNSYSVDEEYVANWIEILSRKCISEYKRRTKTDRALARNSKLKEKLSQQIVSDAGGLRFGFDRKSFENIFRKLATAHVGYEIDALKAKSEPLIAINFAFLMSKDGLTNFNSMPKLDYAPEIGSRACSEIVVTVFEDDLETSLFWKIVQPEKYRYSVSIVENIEVKIVVNELIYVSIVWIK